MINYSELRVGNLVETPRGIYPVGIISYSGIHVQTTKLHPTMLPFPNSTGFGMYHVEHLNPVPISPEWLEKFGYSKEGYNYRESHFVDGRITFNSFFGTKPNEFWIKPTSTDGRTMSNDHLYAKIQYVHQLQNLIFALTGEELTIKKPEETTG
jgi:hypothetical protein